MAVVEGGGGQVAVVELEPAGGGGPGPEFVAEGGGVAVQLSSTALWPAVAVKVGGASADAVGVAVGVAVEDTVWGVGAVAEG